MRLFEAEEKRREEDKRIKALIAESLAWADANRIREYVAVIKKNGKRAEEWIDWALDVANRIDPSCAP